MLVPVMLYIFGMSANVVVGTSLFEILFVTMASTMMHALLTKEVDIVLALLLLVGSVTGAQLGARNLARVGERARSRRNARQLFAIDEHDQPRPVVAVAGPEDMRGVEHDPGQAAVAHRLLAQEFAALVIDPARAAALRRGFVDDPLRLVRVDSHRRGVHESLHTGRLGGAQQVLRALHIGCGLCCGMRAPHAGIGRRMEHGRATG